jgi:hypothetical protein
VLLQREVQPRDGAGRGDGETAGARVAAGKFTGVVSVVIESDRAGRGLAVEDSMRSAAIGQADDHETTSTETRGVGLNDAEGKRGGDGGVDGVAALLEHFDTGGRGEGMCGRDGGIVVGRGSHRCGGE